MAKEFDREGLQAFVDQSEGEPPPVFVGRKGIIQDILRTANRAYQPDALRHGKPKVTRVIHGAPGAGKSSILTELGSRSLPSGDQDTENAPRILIFSSQQLTNNLPLVLASIALASKTTRKKWWDIIRDRGSRLVSSVSALGFSFDAAELMAIKPLGDVSELALEYPPAKWKAPVIVAIDEAQRLSGGRDTPHAMFLQSIHDNDSSLPLTLVLAGLGDTFERAGEVGLTRGLTLHEIGCLSEKNCRVLTKRFCEHYGISGYTESQLAEFARPTEGWPRHLHFALQALGNEALDVDGDLSRADWKNVALQATKSRLDYYNDQWSDEMQTSDGLVAAVMSGLRDNMRASNIDRLIERSVADEPGMRLPKVRDPDEKHRYMFPKEFRQHLVHQGALERRRDKTYHCPIPSNRTFLMMKGDQTVDQMMANEAARQRTGNRRLSLGIERS